jgi:hypothetical protein
MQFLEKWYYGNVLPADLSLPQLSPGNLSPLKIR